MQLSANNREQVCMWEKLRWKTARTVFHDEKHVVVFWSDMQQSAGEWSISCFRGVQIPWPFAVLLLNRRLKDTLKGYRNRTSVCHRSSVWHTFAPVLWHHWQKSAKTQQCNWASITPTILTQAIGDPICLPNLDLHQDKKNPVGKVKINVYIWVLLWF